MSGLQQHRWLKALVYRALPVVLLVGCATPPPSARSRLPVDVPAGYAAEGGVEASASDGSRGWLADFNSEELNALVMEALTSNYDLQITAARLDVSRAGAVIEGASQYPQVSAGLSGSRQKRNFIGFPFGGGGGVPSTTSNNYGLSLDISWELDVWGKLRDRESAALGEVQATAADYAGARLSLAAQTTRAWFGLIEAELQWRLAVETRDSFERNQRIVEDRYRRGLAPAFDLRSIQSQTASAQAEVERRARLTGNARRSLEVLLGRYPADTLTAAASLPVVTRPVPPGLPSTLLERRPDLIAAERRLASADKRISEARKAMLPSISLTGSGGTATDQLKDLLDSSFSVWTLAGNALQPIFQGRRLIAGVERSKAEYQERLAAYAQVTLVAYREVEDALAAEQFLVEQEKALNEAARQAEAAQNLAWQRYRQGVGDITSALVAERTAFESQRNALLLRRERLINRVDLYLALGGDFSDRPDATTAALMETVSYHD